MVIGTYFADLKRLKKLSLNPKFLSKYFSPREMKALMDNQFSPNLIAEMFCIKVAFKKVMRINYKSGRLSDISVFTDYSGTHYITLSGDARKNFDMRSNKINISCTVSSGFVFAVIMFF